MRLSLEDRNALAHAVQAGVPLVPDPFAALGRQLGLDPGAVLDQVAAWHAEGKLREISAVLEGSLLDHESALCAAAVPAADLPRVVEVVNAHPMVTHNYLRDHAYNLWFTIAAPRSMGLDATLARLAAQAGVPRFHAARRTRTYKVGVNFDLVTRRSHTRPGRLPTGEPLRPTAAEIALLRALQRPLPLVERPFVELAAAAGTDEATLLAFARRHLGGVVRRYVGTFRHRALGVHGNGMAVWQVPEARLDEAGRRLARAPEVSHCYAREPFPGFPYTLYSMLHGPDPDACRALAARLAPEVGAEASLVLFSVQEFKKCRLRYFLPELDRWWAASAEVAA